MNTKDIQRLLIIGAQFPEPRSSAAGSRMMQLISLFKSAGYKIAFASAAQETTYSQNLKKEGIEVFKISPNTEVASQTIKSTAPDIVLFDRFMIEEQFGWRVAEVCPKALRLLDTEDLHFLRKARQKAAKENRKLVTDDLYSTIAKRELASILRCDLSLIISEFEHDLLREEFNIDEKSLYYLPFLIDLSKTETVIDKPCFAERQNFMFVGNYLHPPNYDAVLWLKNEIWPLIRKDLPKARLNCYGAYTPQKVKQLENETENFFIRGRAENLTQILSEHRLLLAPLRFGAGLKGKFIEAMQHGLPSVTTSIGAEGIHGDYAFAGSIADTPEKIADAAVKFYTDEKAWKNAQDLGAKIISNRFDKKRFANTFIKHIDLLNQNLETHRQQHFIGELLTHHRQQSTKYMSRWIESKNKLNALK